MKSLGHNHVIIKFGIPILATQPLYIEYIPALTPLLHMKYVPHNGTPL